MSAWTKTVDGRGREKGKLTIVKTPKHKPPFGFSSNSNPKLVLGKKKGVSVFDEQSSSSSSKIGGGFFVNSVQAKGECSLTKKSIAVHENSSKVINVVTLDFSLVDHDNGLGLQNLDPAQDTGLRSEGLLIDFLKNSDSSLEGEEFHIDLSGGPVSNKMGSSKVRKEGPRGRLQGREAKKIQLMMKKVFEGKSSPKLDWLTASLGFNGNRSSGHRGCQNRYSG
ncbi:hypothetical protein LWI29_026740 [Acer saccharum]|uniref:Uncharacterized protein n=1 Tax=Acer saccharum TaxID=4024 RepID=A0AA39SGK2_ACESA|nr:hypothetical protein LWI29_026740 [Acer saccharum]